MVNEIPKVIGTINNSDPDWGAPVQELSRAGI